jgi:hypothetical protein
MAVVINTTLEADTKEAQRQVGKLKKEVEKVGQAAKKSGEDISAAMQIGNEATRSLDKISGGLATKLVKVAKAAKLSGKAMKTALISSGIGAAVVAIGLLVEYWDEIAETLGFINNDLEKQIKLNNQNLEAVDLKLRNLKSQIELEKKQGKNVDNLIEKQKALNVEKKAALLISLTDEKAALQKLKIQSETLTAWEYFLQGYTGTSEITEEENDALIKQQGIISDLENAITNFDSSLLDPIKKAGSGGETDAEKLAEQQRLQAIDDKAASIVEITKLEDDFLQSQLDKQTQEENAVRDKYFTLIEEADEYKLDTTLLEEARQKELRVISDAFTEEAKDKEKKRLEDIQKIVNDATDLSELQKIEKDRLAAQTELDLLGATWIEKARIAAYYQGLINEETTKQNKEANEKQKEDDEKLQDAKFRVASQALDAIASIGNLFAKGNEKNAKTAFRISKAVGIAQAGINTSQAIMKAAAETTDVTPTQSLRTANMIALGIAGAAQIASIAAQKFEGGSSTVPKPSLGGGSQAPAFNVVGASGETQLADAIGSQTQRPARAYVVSNDVTTAQELDRNIIEGASIG